MNSQPNSPQENSNYIPPTPLRCISSSIISGGISTAMYFLTLSIASYFANKPITSTNITVQNISVAIRTLIIGMSALGTAVFAIATLGLMALGIKIIFQQAKTPVTK